MSHAQQQSHHGMDTVVLTDLADGLIADLANHPAGRVARTILTGSVMRAAVIALREGASMREHGSPAAATLYVIRGQVTVRAGEREWTLSAGELIPIPPQRHGLEAHADSAVLLTVALR
ncbi:MAG TPA: cupin domain-containing protein [Nocardioidaceae bacterium]|nr:cupin domain-containing protein [Nocardioidaceae bacterium]